MGAVRADGSVAPGLLSKALSEAQPEHGVVRFPQLCAKAGHAALGRGEYRTALKLLHISGKHGEALQVLCRCLRLPLWADAAAACAGDRAAKPRGVAVSVPCAPQRVCAAAGGGHGALLRHLRAPRGGIRPRHAVGAVHKSSCGDHLAHAEDPGARPAADAAARLLRAPGRQEVGEKAHDAQFPAALS